MTVEERRGAVPRDAGRRDQFPVGMRVLAVDDDPTCLKVLEALLLECKYHVTATNQAIKALKLLRENKDKFDLVISDVHMPDMDGFKLLELVGLEMDLPVIMLSANSNTNVVMKGITHGACDYLLKPIRIEQLKNIWQHVVRRKKFDSKDHTNYDHGDDCENPHHTSDGGQSPITNGPSDHNSKLNRKRKDQNEEEDEESENEDSSTQKKPRVVWTPDLHRKFVVAVNQLGIEKAVPKRILDLMNVEKLTRENVASHLQKYRLLLKKISASENRQENIVAGLGGRDSYLTMGPIDGLGNYNVLAGSRQLQSLTSFQSSGILGRLNSPAGLGLHGLTSNGTIQLGHAHSDTSSFIYDFGKPSRTSLPAIQHGNLPQGMPTSLELDQLRQQKLAQETNGHMLASLTDSRSPNGSSSNSLFNVTNYPLMLQAHQQQAQCSGLGNQSSVKMTSLSPDPFEINVGMSSHLPDVGRCNDTWQGAVPLTGYSANHLPVRVPFDDEILSSCNNLRENISPIASQADNNPHVSPSSMAGAPLLDLLTGDLQCQMNSLDGKTLLMPTSTNETPRFSNFGNVSSSQQKWEEPRQNQNCRPDVLLNSALNSNLHNHDVLTPNSQNLGHINGFGDKEIDATVINQSNFSVPFFTQQCQAEKFTGDGQLRYKDHPMDPSKLQAGFSPNGHSSFNDVMNALLKREREDAMLMDGDIGCDIYSLETCM